MWFVFFADSHRKSQIWQVGEIWIVGGFQYLPHFNRAIPFAVELAPPTRIKFLVLPGEKSGGGADSTAKGIQQEKYMTILGHCTYIEG